MLAIETYPSLIQLVLRAWELRGEGCTVQLLPALVGEYYGYRGYVCTQDGDTYHLVYSGKFYAPETLEEEALYSLLNSDWGPWTISDDLQTIAHQYGATLDIPGQGVVCETEALKEIIQVKDQISDHDLRTLLNVINDVVFDEDRNVTPKKKRPRINFAPRRDPRPNLWQRLNDDDDTLSEGHQ